MRKLRALFISHYHLLKPAIEKCFTLNQCFSIKYPYSPHGKNIPPDTFHIPVSLIHSFKISCFEVFLPIRISRYDLLWGGHTRYFLQVHSQTVVGFFFVMRWQILRWAKKLI